MKKYFALLLALALLLAAVPALAIDAQYAGTRNFLSYLDDNGIKYSYMGISGTNEYEQVRVVYTGDNLSEITINCYFAKDNTRCALLCWNVIDYDEAQLLPLISELNNLNKQYRYARFYTDSSDNSVTAQFDVLLDENISGRFVYRGLSALVDIVDAAYPSLKPYQK